MKDPVTVSEPFFVGKYFVLIGANKGAYITTHPILHLVGLPRKDAFLQSYSLLWKGCGRGGIPFFLIYKICFVGRFAYFYPFLTTILTPPARPKIMSCLKGKGFIFMGSIIAFMVQLFFLTKWFNCNNISGSLLELRQGVPPMKWWYQSLMANCSKKSPKNVHSITIGQDLPDKFHDSDFVLPFPLDPKFFWPSILISHWHDPPQDDEIKCRSYQSNLLENWHIVGKNTTKYYFICTTTIKKNHSMFFTAETVII